MAYLVSSLTPEGAAEAAHARSLNGCGWLTHTSQSTAAPHQIGLPAQLAAKAAVYVAWRASGLSKVALGERLDRREGEVRRILDPNHRTGLDPLEEAAAALGGRLVVSLEDRPVA